MAGRGLREVTVHGGSARLALGVAAGGPAEAAGLRAGDVVVSVDGRQIENIYDYTFVLEALQVGEAVPIVVQRGEERIEATIVPGSRD